MSYDGDDHSIPLSQQHPFWLGVVISLHHDIMELGVRWYSTRSTNVFSGKYRPHCRLKGYPARVPNDSIIAVVPPLTERGQKIPRSPENYQDIIKQRLDNWDGDHDNWDILDNNAIVAAEYSDSDDDDDPLKHRQSRMLKKRQNDDAKCRRKKKKKK
jgi:hypothetical protein